MKKIALIFRTNAIVLAIFLLNFNANAQAGYVREYYTGCYFHTTANSIFTWSKGFATQYLDICARFNIRSSIGL